ncbi:MAG: TnpV protein [Parabacteroides sp.]|nr:TnpV protein [Parabacteroides sp.]
MENKDYTITYNEKDGIFYPDLKLPDQTYCPIGKYGDLRLDFLRKHCRGTYSLLIENAA